MPKRKLPYSEGSWFAVPLRRGGFAVGVVARMDGTGGMMGYFFGPKRDEAPRLLDVRSLNVNNAVLCKMAGDLGLLKGFWPVLGRADDWNRADWPVPNFARKDAVSGQWIRVTYDEDTLEVVREVHCDASEGESLPYDSLAGYGAIEIRLTTLLDPGIE